MKNKTIVIIVCAILLFLCMNIVSFNTKTGIVHKPTCEWAMKCTENCHLTFKFLIHDYHRNCKVCGG